jgi:hypothetical protein
MDKPVELKYSIDYSNAEDGPPFIAFTLRKLVEKYKNDEDLSKELAKMFGRLTCKTMEDDIKWWNEWNKENK